MTQTAWARAPNPGWLDLQYNNRARVREFAQIMHAWQEASLLVHDSMSRRLDVAYGVGPSERLDVFPAPHANAPVLVFIHGGYWRALDKSEQSFVAPSFVADGAMVVVPNYQLCPQNTVQGIVLQMAHALIWVYRHAALYGGDPARMVVVGHSAGGQIAAMLLNCVWPAIAADLPPQLLLGAMSISGIFDMEVMRKTPFLKDDLGLTSDWARKLSPVLLPAPTKPLFAMVGDCESEEFLRQNQSIRRAWGQRAVPVCESIARCNHFTVLSDLADPCGQSHRRVLELMGV